MPATGGSILESRSLAASHRRLAALLNPGMTVLIPGLDTIRRGIADDVPAVGRGDGAVSIMMTRLSPLMVIAMGVLAAQGCRPSSAPAPASSSMAAQIGLTGVWVAVGTFEDPAGPPPWSNVLWPADPPFTEWGREQSRRLADIRNVVPCQPGGPIFAMWELGLFPIEILEAPDRIVIKPENSALPRRIYLDRSHPADLEPSWMGHSIGRWEDDVLVVDTIGTNGKTRAMNGVGSNALVSVDDAKPRLPVSDQLHLVERIRLVADGEVMEDEMTITDPKTYTAPIVVKHYWQRRPDIDVLEYVCAENPRTSDEVNLPAGTK
jgi:hypothetical protein